MRMAMAQRPVHVVVAVRLAPIEGVAMPVAVMRIVHVLVRMGC